MTSLDRTPAVSQPQSLQARTTLLRWFTGMTALLAVVATVILTVTGQIELATTVAVIGAGLAGAGGVQITINIKR
ncbi:hypothetical protein ACFV6G_29445 [Streptomyces lavendulae]|uniref:hypothetical protein n=1 Tax=Streptomyces lavendulae TaxID=1914 RepID=UPI0036A5CAA1